MENKELNLNLNELNLDDLDAVNGGNMLSDAILNNESVANFIRDKKIAGVPLDACITLVCEYLGSCIGRYITRDQVISFVNKIYDSL